ncbi:MAG: endonuclease/exonuclease/phosphatase family protein [Pseudomonadota bacterium]
MERQTLRIATWNLDHASNSKRPIQRQIEAIMRMAPDILVLTETCAQVDLSPYGYSVQYTQPNEYKKYYAAIWSRFPIVHQHETSDPELTVCAQIASSLGDVLVYGTIITYHGDKGPDQKSPAWAEHYKAIGVQGNDWARLRAQAALPMIVAGDFNQTRDGSSRTYGTAHGRGLLTEQLARSGLVCLTTENFGDTGKLKVDQRIDRARNNIDHICVTENVFEIGDVGAWDHFAEDGAYLSDHNGVYVDIAECVFKN